MRYCLLLVILLIQTIVFAQVPVYKNEISFTTENDAYLMKLDDGFYTNGIFIKFSKAKEKNARKTITSYELGQMIFTPHSVNFYRNGEGIDRSFCGYLFGIYNHTSFLTKQQVLQWAVTLGTVGQNSLGQNVQDAIHTAFNYKKFRGWETQIGNEIGLNGRIQYAKTFTPFSTCKNIKVIPETTVNLGNTFINAKASGYVCFGLMENNENSALFNAKIGTKKTVLQHKQELFCYWHPSFILQGYNATVQGGMFVKNASATTDKIRTLMYTQSFGILYALQRISAKLEITYQTKEAELQIAPQRYGSIGIAYRFN